MSQGVRDPRTDPQKGDVLRKDATTREVLGRGVAHSVSFVREQGGHRLRGQKSIVCWRRWARAADVETTA